MHAPGADALRLITLRSNDQFNTTLFGHSDRLRGIEGECTVMLVSPAEIARMLIVEGQRVTLVIAMDDRRRAVSGLKVMAYDLPEGCVADCFPELNPLVSRSLRG